MTGRENQIYQEAAALWRELYGEPPPAQASGDMLLDAITRGLPLKDYERLKSPFLRPSNIHNPLDAGEGDRA